MQDFGRPLLGELPEEREGGGENNAKYYGHYIYACSPRAAHAIRSDQNLTSLQEVVGHFQSDQ